MRLPRGSSCLCQTPALLACTLVACVLTGCNGPKAKPVHPVAGRVFAPGGYPAAKAIVTFHPVGKDGPEAIRPTGQVDEQGRFTLTTYRSGDGAPPGDYKVTVAWFVSTPLRPGVGDESQTYNAAPPQYARAESSPLRVTVNAGKNELQPIELK